MDSENSLSTAFLMLRLIARAIGISDSDVSGIDDASLRDIFRLAYRHNVCALAASGLQKQGIADSCFIEAAAKAKRLSILFDKELDVIYTELEKEQIRYLPLKGIEIKDLYPGLGMREMSDVDILVDSTAIEKVKTIMCAYGYKNSVHNKNHHEVYTKDPLFIIEMHRTLFDEFDSFSQIISYYSQKDFLSGNGPAFRRAMSREDFYIYLIAHMYHHYTTTGIGIRSLADIYLYLKAYGEILDFSYIKEEIEKLELVDYEASVRRLSEQMWDPDLLSEQDKELLEYYLFSGAHGSKKQFVSNRIKNALNGPDRITKAKYIKGRFSISNKDEKDNPFYRKHPHLVPLMRFSKLIKTVFTKPKAIAFELNELRKAKNDSNNRDPK